MQRSKEHAKGSCKILHSGSFSARGDPPLTPPSNRKSFGQKKLSRNEGVTPPGTLVLMHCVYWPSYPKHINTLSEGIQLRTHGRWSKSSVSAVKERRYYTRIKAEVELTRNWRFPGRSFHAGHFSRLKAARFLKPARPPIIIIETGQFAEYTHARTPLCVYTQVQYKYTHSSADLEKPGAARIHLTL